MLVCIKFQCSAAALMFCEKTMLYLVADRKNFSKISLKKLQLQKIVEFIQKELITAAGSISIARSCMGDDFYTSATVFHSIIC